jgi:hypothetical protein
MMHCAAARATTEETRIGACAAMRPTRRKVDAMHAINTAIRTGLRPILIALLGLMLFGCAGSSQMKDVETLKAGQTLVFGSVAVIEDGKPKKWGMTWTGTRELWLLLLLQDSAKVFPYRLAKDGAFAWGLSPGEYSIAGYELVEDSGSRSARIWMRFTVPEGAESLYIGDVTMETLGGLFGIRVEDRYDPAVETFRAKFSEATDQPQKGLMEIDRGIGSAERHAYICSTEWGIECTKSYRGVTPIRPELAKGGFANVDSLTPSFEWKPSSRDDVSYDLVIYEAFAYTRDVMQTRSQYMPGRVAVYEEGLKAAVWRPDTPLKPDRKYFWSVRLRRDGTVTNWSDYSYFSFYLVAWSSGYGQLFGFSTPAK